MQKTNHKSSVVKVAILTETLGMSQKSMSLTKGLNEISWPYKNIDAAVFCLDASVPPVIPRFGTLPMIKAFCHEAIFLATNLETASLLVDFPTAVKKYFYVWDLEWVCKNYNYHEMLRVYCNNELNLVARSKSHFKAIKNSWKEPCGIVEDFDSKAILKLIEGKE